MDVIEELLRDHWHVCHACANRYWNESFNGLLLPQPPQCPACDAPMRSPQVIWTGSADKILLSLGGGPCENYEDTFTEFAVFKLVRTDADIDVVLDAVRAAIPRIIKTIGRRAEPPWWADQMDDRRLEFERLDAAIRAAEDRVVEQVESGLLERRLGELRERTAALLRAELEHHRYVHATRTGHGTCEAHSDDQRSCNDAGESSAPGNASKPSRES